MPTCSYKLNVQLPAPVSLSSGSPHPAGASKTAGEHRQDFTATIRYVPDSPSELGHPGEQCGVPDSRQALNKCRNIFYADLDFSSQVWDTAASNVRCKPKTGT